MTGSQTGFLLVPPTAAVVGENKHWQCQRHISPQAGRALEILGHAIEYLTDEFVLAGGSITTRSAQLDAMQILMALNREIYLDCPEVPTFRQRFLS